MNIADIGLDVNVKEVPVGVELPDSYLVKWTKAKIQFPDAKYSFEDYRGFQNSGSVVFHMRRSEDPSCYKLDVSLHFEFGEGEDDFTILSDQYVVETIEEGFELSEKINKAFNKKCRGKSNDSTRTV